MDSLALILKSKKIRFSKLTTVDDPVEYSYIKDNINPAQYVFVSCWTSSCFENIPQWKMYANGGHGVRIGLYSNMFNIKKYNGKHLNVFPDEYFCDKDFLIMPITSMDAFLSEVNYTEHYSSIIDNIFKEQKEISLLDFKELGKYKMIDCSSKKKKDLDYMSFQKSEIRYLVILLGIQFVLL